MMQHLDSSLRLFVAVGHEELLVRQVLVLQ